MRLSVPSGPLWARGKPFVSVMIGGLQPLPVGQGRTSVRFRRSAALERRLREVLSTRQSLARRRDWCDQSGTMVSVTDDSVSRPKKVAPVLFVMVGLPAIGKTTRAKQIEEERGPRVPEAFEPVPVSRLTIRRGHQSQVPSAISCKFTRSVRHRLATGAVPRSDITARGGGGSSWRVPVGHNVTARRSPGGPR